ncbi:MAG: hypothetical protein KJ025_17720 [Burkholderiales bacterium]|nr:hypothetical protein [Burkholderiales bacterium]
MIHSSANVIVHVAGTLDAAARARLEGALAAAPGVARAQRSARAPRLTLVDYDPHATSALAIVSAARAQGFDARLIGM